MRRKSIGPALILTVVTLGTAVGLACASTVAVSPPATPEEVVLAPSIPTQTESPDDQVEGKGTLAQTTFVHSGFRTEVSRTLKGIAPKEATTGRRLSVTLNNLSEPTGTLQSRATINFSRTFRNFVVLSSPDGPFRLYLHRDGTLRSSPDQGGFI